MTWLWMYIGGALAWVLAITAAIHIWIPEKDQDSHRAGSMIMMLIWPVGVVLVFGALIGEFAKGLIRK